MFNLILASAAAPNDFGPLYTETLMGRFPVEPWNTCSNFAFLAIIIYWIRKTGLNYRRFPLLAAALPILTIGFLGGTIYHATRGHPLWLILDFGPILLLTLLAAFYFWQQLTGKIWLAFILLLLPPLLVRGIPSAFTALTLHHKIALGYIGLAFSIILPALLYCRKLHWRGLTQLCACLIAFALAITARQLDSTSGAALLPMGSHFLWHLWGALATHLLISFIYLSNTLAVLRSSPVEPRRQAEQIH